MRFLISSSVLYFELSCLIKVQVFELYNLKKIKSKFKKNTSLKKLQVKVSKLPGTTLAHLHVPLQLYKLVSLSLSL